MEIRTLLDGSIQLERVFNGIVLKSPIGERMVITMRDGGFEFTYQGKTYSAKGGKLTPNGLSMDSSTINKMSKDNKHSDKQQSDNDFMANVRHNTSRKGTNWYMIFITALCGLLSGIGWYHFGIEVGIFTLLLLVVMFLASIRYNQQ